MKKQQKQKIVHRQIVFLGMSKWMAISDIVANDLCGLPLMNEFFSLEIL